MIFRILDGRDTFFQWDLNRKIVVEDPTIDEVHFCNKTDDCSLVVKVYEVDGLRVADVPNILLQDSWPINVFGYCGSSYTKQHQVFKINKRSKPADYVYTETEIYTYKQLEDRIIALEEGGVPGGGDGPDIDLSKYATKDELNAAVANKITVTYLNAMIANFVTEEQVNVLIKNKLGVIENGSY